MTLHSAVKGKLLAVIGDEVSTIQSIRVSCVLWWANPLL